MKHSVEDKALLADPLVKWVKTFKYDVEGSDFHNLSQLFESKYLDSIILLIKSSKKQKQRPQNGTHVSHITVADRLHTLRQLLNKILDFYRSSLHQIVMIKLPDLVKISESNSFNECGEEIKRLLILILGCATQCSKREDYIERISKTLSEREQKVVQEHFDRLADNSMTSDSSSIEYDDNLLHMHTQIGNLTEEKLQYFEKYLNCFEKHSTSTFDIEKNQYEREYNIPIIIRSVIPVDHGDQWQVAPPRSPYGHYVNDRGEEDVMVIRYKPTVRLGKLKSQSGDSNKFKPANNHKRGDDSLSSEEKDELERRIKELEHQLRDSDMHKKRVNELQQDNSKLILDKRRLQEQLNTSRRKEEDVIERLVDAQMKLDEAIAEREQDRKKLQELMQQNHDLSTRSGDNYSEFEPDSLAPSASNQKNKLKEYEREIESLKTRLMEAQKQENQSDDKWKFLEVQKEKLDARRELNDTNKENENLQQEVVRLRHKVNNLQKELDDAQEVADLSKSASDDQVSQLEDRIQELTRQVMTLRKKGGKLGTNNEKLKEWEENESELLYETVQQLTTEVTRLKSHNKVLRQTCDKLKHDTGRFGSLEMEIDRLLQENRRLEELGAAKQGSAEVDDELRRQNIQLQVENKKLRRMIDTLRYMLMQVDPHNKHKYNYITSF